MSYSDAFNQASAIAQKVVDGVQADQLSASTPCEEWNAQQLLSHLIGGQRIVAASVRGDDLDYSVDFADTPDLSGAFAAAHADAAAALASVDADQTINLPWGEMRADALAGIMASDNYVHAWDLAVATDQDRNFDADLGGKLLAGARQMISPEMRQPGFFGAEVAVADDAPVADQLAGFLGRQIP